MKIEKIDMIVLTRLSNDEKVRLRNKARYYIALNYKLIEIADILCMSMNAVGSIVAFNPNAVAELGHKDESYCSEEELITGFKCSYEDLSVEEKTIWNRI